MTTASSKTKTVGDIMTRNPVRVDGATTAAELAAILDSNEVSGVPVVDAQERVIGVVSKTDLLHQCVEGPLGSRPGSFLSSIAEGLGGELDADALGTVADFMNAEPITARSHEPVEAVAYRMADERVHRIVVVDADGRLEGIVTSLDLVRVLAS